MSFLSFFFYLFLGQFGKIDFSVSVFLGFLIATFTSILDSVGDYYACASTCRVPPPPSHAVNRGIAVEGFCTAIAGFLGCGLGTTTYGGNVGAIGVTRVTTYFKMYISYIWPPGKSQNNELYCVKNHTRNNLINIFKLWISYVYARKHQ